MIAPDNRAITCSSITPQNPSGKLKTVATIQRDGVLVWCQHCRQEHLIPRYACETTWSHGGLYRVTCSVISERNDYGRAKLVAKIIPDAILEWCRYCHVAHRITREQCEQVWTD